MEHPTPSVDVLVADAQIPQWCRQHNLPGLIDVHVHFLPPDIQAKVWAQFDQAGPKIGRDWPIRYRGSYSERVEQLRSFGVQRFGALPYAHRPGIATYFNEWAGRFAAEVPEALHSATFYPEPGVEEYVGAELTAGVEVFKLHTQVGEFYLDDPQLDGAWELLEEAGTPVVVHVGSAPIPNQFTGVEHLQRLLGRFPRLRVIVAHLGAPEFVEFLTLAHEYPRLLFDTTMVFTDFFSQDGQFPQRGLELLVELSSRILLGSDFPAIPYPYAHQLEALARLRRRHDGLDDEWLRAVCWDNPARYFSVAAEPRPTIGN